MTMYRKRRKAIEAIQWTGDIESISKTYWVKDEKEKGNILFVAANHMKDRDIVCFIGNGNEMRKVDKMSYIVKQGKSIYINSEKEFEEMYEPIKSESKRDLTIKVDLDITEAEEKINRLNRSMDNVSEICMNTGKK